MHRLNHVKSTKMSSSQRIANYHDLGELLGDHLAHMSIVAGDIAKVKFID